MACVMKAHWNLPWLPQKIALNYENASLAVCAATYAYHLTQSHAFVDGNKRVAAAATELFIELNGKKLLATNQQLIDLFLTIAASEATREEVEQTLKHWIH
ncbi:MAG: type II toxin-antitoxin system death-on-curing family toxin [Caldilinea sp. CFX5]|nr:type II toxin-antitoxin system death-on-curing family toxin [Caldilinea sp. CFX5]